MAIEYKPKAKVRCYCKKCYNYLKTNPLCRLGRKTPQEYCKWYGNGQGIKESGYQLHKLKKKKEKAAQKCMKCEFNQEGFCKEYERWASNARKECIK